MPTSASWKARSSQRSLPLRALGTIFPIPRPSDSQLLLLSRPLLFFTEAAMREKFLSMLGASRKRGVSLTFLFPVVVRSISPSVCSPWLRCCTMIRFIGKRRNAPVHCGQLLLRTFAKAFDGLSCVLLLFRLYFETFCCAQARPMELGHSMGTSVCFASFSLYKNLIPTNQCKRYVTPCENSIFTFNTSRVALAALALKLSDSGKDRVQNS